MSEDFTKVAELSHDLQLGISRISIPEFEHLPCIGMAGVLSMHIRGLGELDYSVLRQVADHFFDIPAMVLEQPLRVLEAINYVTLVTEGNSIKKVIPNIPHFDSVYDGLGQYISSQKFTEHEQVVLSILSELSNKPVKRDSLMGKLGAENKTFKRCESIIEQGGLLVTKRARGQSILVSPAYFADNLDQLADIAATGNSPRIERIVKLISQCQGWPLSLIESCSEINGVHLTPEELVLLKALVSDGILKPPSIEVPNKPTERFIFTPRPGNLRLGAANREIYERAMGLVASVRKGQLLPEKYRIRDPLAILTALRDKKKIGANSEASSQYRNLVTLRVGRLQSSSSGRSEFVLIEEPENIQALNQAISLLQFGRTGPSGVSQEARIALSQDEKYIQSLVASAKFRKIDKSELGPEEEHEIEQLLLGI